MSRPPSDPSRPLHATVLAVGPSRVEVFHRRTGDGSLYAAAEVEDPTPATLVESVSRLVREAGLRPGACQVVLTDGLASDRIVSVPPLGSKELRQVLHRKAANLLGCSEGETVFAAVPMRRSLDASGERKYLLVAVALGTLHALGFALLERGFQPREVLWERLAALGADASRPGEGDTAAPTSLVVVVESEAISLSLVRGDDLVHQATLQGRLAESQSLATVLIQEMRGLEAYWRKLGRGAALDEVVLVGVAPSVLESLEPALRFAMPEVSVRRHPATGQGPRADVLCASTHPSHFRYDLGVTQPLRKRLLLSTAILSALLAVLVGIRQYGELTESVQQVRDETAALAAQMRDYSVVESRYQRVQATVQQLDAERAGVRVLGGLGVPLEATLSAALEAFHGYGALLSISCETADRGRALSISGTTVADPRTSLVALQGLVDALVRSPLFERVELLPPSNVTRPDEAGEGPERLDFAIRGAWRNPL